MTNSTADWSIPEPIKVEFFGGRIVGTQISPRKWEIRVDGCHVFTTNRGVKGLLYLSDFWTRRLSN